LILTYTAPCQRGFSRVEFPVRLDISLPERCGQTQTSKEPTHTSGHQI